jgi:cystine transport system ATP-binding protein
VNCWRKSGWQVKKPAIRGVYPVDSSSAAIARALAMRPEVILFDEPTSALDPELVGEVLNTIRQLAQEKRTMVIVTHEMSFARDVADRAIFMDQGRIVEQGPAKSLFTHPQQPRTRQFLEKFLMQ